MPSVMITTMSGFFCFSSRILRSKIFFRVMSPRFVFPANLTRPNTCSICSNWTRLSNFPSSSFILFRNRSDIPVGSSFVAQSATLCSVLTSVGMRSPLFMDPLLSGGRLGEFESSCDYENIPHKNTMSYSDTAARPQSCLSDKLKLSCISLPLVVTTLDMSAWAPPFNLKTPLLFTTKLCRSSKTSTEDRG